RTCGHFSQLQFRDRSGHHTLGANLNQVKVRLILLTCFLVSQTSDFAQTILSGKIMDEKNQPLPGVNVFIKGSVDGTSSDAAGNYQFETTETGTQTLVWSMMGFKSQEKTIILEAGAREIPALTLREEFNELNT